MKIIVCFFFLVFPISFIFSQSALLENDITNYREMVVMIDNYSSGFYGAGIIVNYNKNATTIITAAHNLVVPNQSLTSDKTIEVSFFHNKDKSYPIHVIHKDTELDIAVLTVKENIGLNLPEHVLEVLPPIEIEGTIGQGCKFIGYMKQMEWNFNPDMGSISEGNHATLRFSSQYVSPGASGGPLLTEHGTLAGMITDDNLLGSEALSIDRILKLLDELKINTHLKVNDKALASMALKRLNEKGVLNEYGLTEAINQKNEQILNDFGVASKYIDIRLLTRGLQAEVQWEKGQSVIFNYLKESDSSLSYQWLIQLIKSGVDPNLMVPHSYFEKQSLLITALNANNTNAVTALLNSGASPHGYQNINKTGSWNPHFLNPLFYVLDIENAKNRDQLFQQFLDSGTVIPREGTTGGYRYTMGIVNKLNKKYRKIYSKELKPTPTIHQQAEDIICSVASERDNFDWCKFSRDLFPLVSYYNMNGNDGRYGTDICRLEYLLHISENKIYFLASSDIVSNDQFESYSIVEIPRNETDWYVYSYGRGYKCKPDDEFDKVNYCWSKYIAWPTAIGKSEVEESQNRKAEKTSSPIDLISKHQIDGIGLNTSIAKLEQKLLQQGYVYSNGSPTVKEYMRLVKEENFKFSTMFNFYNKYEIYAGSHLEIVIYNSEIVYIHQSESKSDVRNTADRSDLEDIITQLKAFEKKKDGFSLFEYNKFEDGRNGLSLTALGNSSIQSYYFHISVVGHSLHKSLIKRQINESSTQAAFFEGWNNLHQGLLYRKK